jgi:pyruvate decarboxylase
LSGAHPPNDAATESFVVDSIIKLVEEADGDVALIVDVCAVRHDTIAEVRELVEKTGFPVYSTPMAKALIVNETYERYGGVSDHSFSKFSYLIIITL